MQMEGWCPLVPSQFPLWLSTPSLLVYQEKGQSESPAVTQSLLSYLRLNGSAPRGEKPSWSGTNLGNPSALQLCLHKMTLLLVPYN